MQTKELQKKAVEIVDAIDRKFSVSRDAQLNFTQLAEEIHVDCCHHQYKPSAVQCPHVLGEDAQTLIILNSH